MVDKISVEIALDGGDEVNRQLEGILQTGQKTFTGLQDAAEQLDFSAISSGFQEIGQTGVQAFDKIQAAVKSTTILETVVTGLKKVEGAFENLGTAATKMATRMSRSLGVFGVLARSFGPAGIAAGIAAGAFVKFGNDAANALLTLNVEAAKLDLTTQKFDTLQKALGKLGIGSDTVVPGLQKLKESLGQNFFPTDVATGLQRFIEQLAGMPDGLDRTKLAIDRLGEAFGGQVIAGLQAGTLTAQNFTSALGSVTPATQQQIVAAEQYRQALNALSDAWTKLKDDLTAPILTPALQWLAAQLPGIASGIEATVQEFQALWGVINTVATAGAAVIGVLVDSVMGIGIAVQTVIDKFLQLIGLKRQAQAGGTMGPLQPGSVGFEGRAAGGLLGGSGTGTSDSNLAWVSRGEYITPARAVAQPGVLGFLEALRRSGGNLSRVLDGMGRFALGGLVPRMPAFATGGLAGGGDHVTIQFPGLPAIGGLRASSDVVDQLHRAAALAQVRSGGRKPSRYA